MGQVFKVIVCELAGGQLKTCSEFAAWPEFQREQPLPPPNGYIPGKDGLLPFYFPF